MGDFEEKFLLLRDENTALKKKKNEQEATIKRMYTKLAIIEEALKKKRQAEESDNQQDPEAAGKAMIPVKRDLDTERFINALKNENIALRRKNQTLQEKNRHLSEKIRQLKLKPHLARSAHLLAQSTAKAPSSGATRKSHQNQGGGSSSSGKTHHGFPGSTLGNQVDHARKLHRDTLSSELEQALKSRLVVAEKQLVKLQMENERLRSETGASALRARKTKDNNDTTSSDEEDSDETYHRSKSSAMEIEQLKRELRDRQAQLSILNARYDNLESNAVAEREIQEKTLDQLEAMNRQVHKLRTQLQDANMEREELEGKAAKCADIDKELALVREQNRRLEDRMTALCESPFINDAFQRKERIDKMFDLEKQCEQQKVMIAHMTDENQKLQVINKELQSNIKLIKQAKDSIDQELVRVKQHLNEERNARSLAVVKATSEIPVASTSPKEVPKRSVAITIPVEPEKCDASSSPVRMNPSPADVHHSASSHLLVSRRYGDQTFAESSILEFGGHDDSAKPLQHRVHMLQMAHLKAMQELERCEKMLHAQTNINRELSLEIEDLTARKLSASSALQGKIKELALLAEERQQKIHQLEGQIRQLKYARAKLRQTAQFFSEETASDSSGDEVDSDVESISESLIMAARDLAPGEQLLELLIISATFDRNVVSANSSTFVLCDFYDFESQTTPLFMGSRPEYSFSSTYRVTVDGFFLRYLASETLVLEVHQAVRGDFKLIGRALIRLSSLLRSKGVLKEHTLPVKSILSSSEGKVIGTINVVIRLSCPVSEIWRLHLRSFPQDAQLLERGKVIRCLPEDTDVLAVEAGSNSEESQQSHPVNELQVTVLGCRNLRSYGKKRGNNLARIPSSYVHYQLLGFPDVFTNIVPETAAPEFDLECSKQTFVMEVDACLLRFFTKFRLWLTVFDDQIELDGDDSDDGMIGRCGLLLSDLAECKPIRGWFPLRDRGDQPAGEISVLIQWKNHFEMLSILGYELIDVEKTYDGLTKERPRVDANAATMIVRESITHPSSSEPAKPIDLDAEVLEDSKLPTRQVLSHEVAKQKQVDTKKSKLIAGDAGTNPVLAVSAAAVSAASEFQRRKQAFMDRMKAIASTSSKSLVHEELEKKQMQRRLESTRRQAAARPQHILQTARGEDNKTPRGKQVHFQKQAVTAAEVVLKLRAQFENNKDGGAALMNRLSYAAGEQRPWIDQPRFALCLKQLGAPLSTLELQVLFDAFGEISNRDKLDYDVFVRKTLRLHVDPRRDRSEQQFTKEDESRLQIALNSAAQHSGSTFQQAFQLFEERCVVHRFGDVAPSVFWKYMESSGLVELISKKGAGLLARKFLGSGTDSKEHGDGEKVAQEAIPLKAVYSFLRAFVPTKPASPVKKPIGVREDHAKGLVSSPLASPPRRDQQESRQKAEDEKHLQRLLATANEHSRDAFLQAFRSFQERCAAQHFADIAPFAFWNLMGAAGFVGLLSKKGIGLLAQKFLTRCRISSSTEEESKVGDDQGSEGVIPLKAVSSFLLEYAPKDGNSPSAEQICSQREDLIACSSSPLPDALSQLLTYCGNAGIDVRGEFEKIDTQYSGHVSAMEFKQVILGLGIGRFCGDIAPEAVIGQLVRQFRASTYRDAVAYTLVLWKATQPSPLPPDLEWYPITSEHLRSRIRRKAGFSGRLDFRDKNLYTHLDGCFAHFDRAREGFLTLTSLHEGLVSLKYDLSIPQVQALIVRMGVFKTGAPTLSRIEFDSFVLDPYASGVLEKLARELLIIDKGHDGELIPRIAQLSRALLARDTLDNKGVLSKQVFWSCLEETLDRKVPQTTKFSLQHLFDVNRDAMIAYRLFMKVISQWQKDATSGSAADHSALAEEKTLVSPSSRSRQHKGSERNRDPERRRELLRSLYNQLSSLDFASQVEIVEEHLQRKDPRRSGCIKWKHLARIFDEIGISLSKTASASMLTFFSKDSNDDSALDDDGDALIFYDRLIKALQRTHGEAEDDDADAKRESRRK